MLRLNIQVSVCNRFTCVNRLHAGIHLRKRTRITDGATDMYPLYRLILIFYACSRLELYPSAELIISLSIYRPYRRIDVEYKRPE
jgi:hypothetical protein